MKEIGAFEAKSKLGQLLDWVEAGEEIIITRRGKAVARMISADAVFDRLVYSKIRERLGGEMRIAASGAAPLGKELAQFFAAIGMPLIEGYGLTEAGVVALNPLDRPKPGSSGAYTR